MYTKEEQKEHRELWVKALRSGEYEQGQGALCQKKEDDGTIKYCCFGVACEISGLGDFTLMPNLTSGYLDFVVDEQPQDATVLPDAVRDWLGLSDRYGSYQGSNHGDNDPCLMASNDEGVPFATIADIIESEPNELVN